jgi:hypothetical protein
MRNMRVYVLSKSKGTWTRIGASTTVDGSFYNEDFRQGNDVKTAPMRTEPDGEVLVLDGAHTEQSLAAVARELQRRVRKEMDVLVRLRFVYVCIPCRSQYIRDPQQRVWVEPAGDIHQNPPF